MPPDVLERTQGAGTMVKWSVGWDRWRDKSRGWRPPVSRGLGSVGKAVTESDVFRVGP